MSMNIPKASALEIALAESRAWVDLAVIGLNLCPFAKAAQVRGRTRFVCTDVTEPAALLDVFRAEARALLATPSAERETTLVIHPWVLNDFDAYNDFLDVVDAALEALGAVGVLQVASFHPHYRFAGTAAEDLGNATNRSPHPTLQLLREASVDAAVAAFPDSATIYEANIATLQRLGPAGWAALQAEWTRAGTAALTGAPDSS